MIKFIQKFLYRTVISVKKKKIHFLNYSATCDFSFTVFHRELRKGTVTRIVITQLAQKRERTKGLGFIL